MKLIRLTTVPISLSKLIGGQPQFMQENGFEVKLASGARDEIKIIEREAGIMVKTLPFTRRISPLKDLKALWLTIKYFNKEKPDIVHTHTPKAGTIGMLAAWLCNVPVRMHTVAGLPLLESNGLKRIILGFIEKITYSCSTKVYPNSFGLKEIILQNKYCSISKLDVIGNGSSNGINTEYFSAKKISKKEIIKYRKEFNISVNDIVFIFVGRLVSDKGINELVKAFSSISQKYNSVKLLLVGNRESDLDPLLDETEKYLQNNSSIIQAGYQSDVRPFLLLADVLAFPSYREGFPNVVMQAGAMGLPSIVSNINGCNEIIKDNVNGLIIPPKDEESLELTMIELLENKEKREFLANNSRKLITDRYEQQMVWELIKKEYYKQLKIADIV